MRAMGERAGNTVGTAASGPSRLRICIILPKLRIGGAEIQVMHLVENLDPKRFEVHLCLLNEGDRSMEEQAGRHAESIERIDFRMRYLPLRFCRLYRYIRKNRFDVLHCHLPLADLLGRIAGRLAGVPVLMTTEHGKHLWKAWWHRLLERILAGSTDIRICVSHDILELRTSSPTYRMPWIRLRSRARGGAAPR
jgi:hypothetical protein